MYKTVTTGKDLGRKGISIFLAFLFSLFFYLSMLCLCLGIITSKGYFKAVLKSSNYTTLATNELRENLSDLAIPSGLPPKFFNDKIYTEYLNRYLNESIDAFYSKNSSFKPDTTSLKQKINQDLLNYANNKGSLVTDEVTKGLDNVADLCVEDYLSYSSPLVFGQMLQVFAKVSSLPYVAFGILAFLSFLLLLFVRKINSKKGFVRYARYGFLGSALMQIILPFILIIMKVPNKLAIELDSLLSFMTKFLSWGLSIAILLGLLSVVVTLIFFHPKKALSDR